MPFIQAKLTLQLNEAQKDELQNKLSCLVSDIFSKPQAYIMSEVETNCNLYMANKNLEKGAYISISLLGSATKQACQLLTKSICEVLKNDLDIDGSNIYITYHPTDLWGWNSMMF